MTRLIKLFSVLAVLLVGLALMPVQNVAAATTYHIQLKSITCIKKQDTFNKDKPYIKINGATVWSGSGFKKGVSVSLVNVAPAAFSNQTTLALWEEDNSSGDDLLGTRLVVGASEVGTGDVVARFAQGGWDYEIIYEVNP